MPRLLLSDEHWSKLREILLHKAIYNKRDLRMTVEGMLYRMRTGCPWRDLPKAFGYWNKVYKRFNAGRRYKRIHRKNCLACCSPLFKRTAQLSRARTAARQEDFSSAAVSLWACLILRTIHQIVSITAGTRTAITGATLS